MMAEASIPVDLFNPGQVFACLGFLEAADVLLGDAEGGFDWSEVGKETFSLRANGDGNPFAAVLEFLAEAEVEVARPAGVVGPWPEQSVPYAEFPAPLRELLKSNRKGYSPNALPVAITNGEKSLFLSSWLEGDGRSALKLFAGNQVAARLVSNLINGKDTAPGLRQLLPRVQSDGCKRPFDVVGPVGSRFGFDARGAWDAIRIGTSLDRQRVLIEVAPHVELLAVIGLEYARPELRGSYEIRYSAWGHTLPTTLARAALATARLFLPTDEYRVFCAHLGDDQQYKKCFTAQEEPSK